MTSSDKDRRHNHRPSPPRPGFNLRIDQTIAPIMRRVQPPLRGAGLLWILIGCCVLWSYWCIEVRMAPLRGALATMGAENRIRVTVDQLRQTLSKTTENALQSDIATARANILEDFQSLAIWVESQAQIAADNGLLFSYTIGSERDSAMHPEILKIPVDLRFKINVHSAANDSYARLMNQLQELHATPWAKALTRSEMEAENGRATVLELTVDLWMFRPTDESDAIELEIGEDLAVQFQ